MTLTMISQQYVKPYEHEGFMALSDLLILQACNTNLRTTSHLLKTAGEMGNQYGYYLLAKYFKKIHNYEEMQTYLQLNIDYFECQDSMLEMGLYYDDICADDEKMVEYYELASNHGNIDATYNLFTFYRAMKDDVNIRKYLDRGVDLGDGDAIYEYALYHFDKQNIDLMMKYYEWAVECDGKNLVNDGIVGFNILLLIKYIENLPKRSEEMEKRLHLLKTKYTDYLIYRNKITLFSKLNHIAECSICYETKLQIDLKCAHTFCIDCYPNLYKKCCPMCRI